MASTANGSAATPSVKAKFCLNCQKDLTRNIRITCAECSSHDKAPVELCVECFGTGTEFGDHKKTHAYRVSDCLQYPLVRENPLVSKGDENENKDKKDMAMAGDWTAEEELLLLEALEMFGMGNWKDVAEHVGSKSDKKCERHYMQAYLRHADLMPRFLQDDLSLEEEKLEVGSEKVKEEEGKEEQETVGEKRGKRGRPSKKMGPDGVQVKAHPGSELAGYMPLRGDFDVEPDNDAELILGDMEFSSDDHPSERALKLKVVHIYNQKLDERAKRKKFVVERGLLDYKKHQAMERRKTKDEREIGAQMRPFARFQSPEEHEQFVSGLVKALRLRKQISLLQEYRKNGVRTLEEAELYDAEKKKREMDQALAKERESAAYLYRGKEAREMDAAPGAHLLTNKEKEVCEKLTLLPKHYLVIKDALVRECYRLGYLSRENATEMVKIDAEKTNHLYDFFVKCGWVYTSAGTSNEGKSDGVEGKETSPKRKADQISSEA